MFSIYIKCYHHLSFVCPIVSLFLYMIDCTFFTDIRRMSHSTKRPVSVKIHLTQAIFFALHFRTPLESLHPFPFACPNVPKAQFHQQYFHPPN